MNFIKKWLGLGEWGSKARKEREHATDKRALDRWLIEESLAGEVHPSELPCNEECCGESTREPEVR